MPGRSRRPMSLFFRKRRPKAKEGSPAAAPSLTLTPSASFSFQKMRRPVIEVSVLGCRGFPGEVLRHAAADSLGPLGSILVGSQSGRDRSA